MNKERALREHVLYLLRGGGAHISLEEAVGCSQGKAASVSSPHDCAWHLSISFR